MKGTFPLIILFLAFTLPLASAGEPHGAVTAFREFVAAFKAKDGRKIGHFITPHQWPALVKSGKREEIIPKLVAAAEKDGATFSFEETKGGGMFLTGEVIIQPADLRVPVQKGGDPWTLDVGKLAGEVEVAAEEKQAYLTIGQLIGNLNFYKDSAGSYPSTEQGLEALMVKPTIDPVPRRWFRLRSEIPKDPWGNDFVYSATADGITIRSLGPDGKESGDDIVNPF